MANTAQQIAAKGNNPTIQSIRAILKSGSSGIIAQHLRTWKVKQDSTQQMAIKEKLPEEFVALIKGLWEKLVNQADEQVITLQQSTEQTILSSKQNIDKLQRENNQWQQQFHALKQEKDSLASEKATLEQIIASRHTENATLQAKYEGLVQQLHEKQTRLDELSHLSQQTQANLEHYREAAREQRMLDQQRAEQQQRQLEQTLQQLQQKLTMLDHEHTSLLQQVL